MNTRPYADLIALVEALAGCSFAAQETARAKYWVNRRAQCAYAESEYWPRFFVVGEERIVSEEGLLPDEQTGLSDIGTILRIHATEPFRNTRAFEYGDFVKTRDGTIITGYQATGISSGESLLVAGDLNPDFAGNFAVSGEENGFPSYANISNITQEINNIGLTWYVGDIIGDGWVADQSGVDNPATPDFVTSWTPFGNATGSITITAETLYSAYITYKAALPDTYGPGETEEGEIPEEWFEYIAHGAYSDFLRNDQQQEKAALAEIEAGEILTQQLEKIGRQGGSSVFTRVITQTNSQWR